VGLLALSMGGKKKAPQRGTVTPLDDELVQVRPPKTKPLADELADMSDEPGPSSSAPPSSAPAARAAAELFAATAVQQAQLPPPVATATPITSQKEASPFRPPPPLPTAPVPAPAPAPTSKLTPTGPIIDVVYDPEVNGPRNVSPVLQPKSQGPQIPAGYDPAKAKAGAPAIASMLAKKGPANYARDQMKGWQKLAALTPDGLYGGSTRGALIHFGVKDPPRPFFKPVATVPYTPPEQRV
jgi:hypothetical protein